MRTLKLERANKLMWSTGGRHSHSFARDKTMAAEVAAIRLAHFREALRG